VEGIVGRHRHDAADERLGIESAAAFLEIVAFTTEIRLEPAFLGNGRSREQAKQHEHE